MIKVGIDAISFFTSNYYLDLKTLAQARGIDVEKFHTGLGQHHMGIPAPDEDIVTLASNAAMRLLKWVNPQDIDTLVFATESGIDQSKAAGLFVHQLLKLPTDCRVLEVKQACYSCTGALMLMLPRLILEPSKKILLIASDVSRYGLNTPGESSQGCGAVAMVLSANPRLLEIDPRSGVYTEDVMDFWRPNYLDEAIVEGKYSAKLYLHALEQTWENYTRKTGLSFDDHSRFCYHNSVPRLVEKAHNVLAKFNQKMDLSDETFNNQIQAGIDYGRKIGNSYAASLYISFVSLLDNAKTNLSNQRIGFYSYGSGCVAEYFSGILQPDYENMLDTDYHQHILNSRIELSYEDYKKFYLFDLPQDGRHLAIPKHQKGPFRLSEINRHKRIYDKST